MILLKANTTATVPRPRLRPHTTSSFDIEYCLPDELPQHTMQSAVSNKCVAGSIINRTSLPHIRQVADASFAQKP